MILIVTYNILYRWKLLLGWRCPTICSRPSHCLVGPSSEVLGRTRPTLHSALTFSRWSGGTDNTEGLSSSHSSTSLTTVLWVNPKSLHLTHLLCFSSGQTIHSEVLNLSIGGILHIKSSFNMLSFLCLLRGQEMCNFDALSLNTKRFCSFTLALSLCYLFMQKTHVNMLLFIADNLACFPYQSQEEPLFIMHHIDICLSVSGSNLLQTFKEVG